MLRCWFSGTGEYEYGVVFRASTGGSLYHVFTVTNDGKYNVARYRDEKYTDLIPYTASPLVNTGSTRNRSQVGARGSQFDFYLNSQLIGTVTDAANPNGGAGVFFYNKESNVQVAFDKLTVSTFNPPTSTPTGSTPAAVAPGVYVTRSLLLRLARETVGK